MLYSPLIISTLLTFGHFNFRESGLILISIYYSSIPALKLCQYPSHYDTSSPYIGLRRNHNPPSSVLPNKCHPIQLKVYFDCENHI